MPFPKSLLKNNVDDKKLMFGRKKKKSSDMTKPMKPSKPAGGIAPSDDEVNEMMDEMTKKKKKPLFGRKA